MINRIDASVDQLVSQSIERPPFPQSGWHPVDVLCAAMGMEHRAFMENLKRLGIPYKKFGVVCLVQVEDFLERLPVIGESSPARPKDDSQGHAATLFAGALERIATSIEKMAKCGTAPDGRPSDAEVLHYMTKLGDPLPPIRTIAAAVGWSHSHILKSMPLSAAYFHHHNGRDVRPVWRAVENGRQEGNG